MKKGDEVADDKDVTMQCDHCVTRLNDSNTVLRIFPSALSTVYIAGPHYGLQGLQSERVFLYNYLGVRGGRQ